LEGAHKPDEFMARLYKKVFVENKFEPKIKKNVENEQGKNRNQKEKKNDESFEITGF
jgi:hypothetical protein